MSEWDEEAAEWYAEKFGEYATTRLGLDGVTLDRGAAIVDIGCGTGATLRHASTRVDGPLIGIDPVPRMVEIARERLAAHPAASRIELRVGKASALPVDDDAADVVLAFDSFDHWGDRVAGLAEVARVLRSGGLFIVVKDAGAPSPGSVFGDAAQKAGFVIRRDEVIEAEGVTFRRWVCGAPFESGA